MTRRQRHRRIKRQKAMRADRLYRKALRALGGGPPRLPLIEAANAATQRAFTPLLADALFKPSPLFASLTAKP